MEGGAWQAMVHRVADSRTRLKRLSTHSKAQEVHKPAQGHLGGRPGLHGPTSSPAPLDSKGRIKAWNAAVHGVAKSQT